MWLGWKAKDYTSESEVGLNATFGIDEVHGFRQLQFSVCFYCKNPLPLFFSANCSN